MRRTQYRMALGITGILAMAVAGCPRSERVLEPLPAPHLHRVDTPSPLAPLPEKPCEQPGHRSLQGAVVVIDPGHGGKDPGAWKGTKSKLPEKTIVLDIAREVADLLSARGAQVVLTRKNDVFISLEARAAMAEKHRADLFVSIHADSSPRRSVSGTGVHIHTAASTQSQRAAFRLVSAFKTNGIPCRGIYRNNFHVLREHNRPSLLIECGFLTNEGDARQLNTSSYRSEMARAIADAVQAYICG